MNDAETRFRSAWGSKTVRQLEAEISSWHRHLQKHSSAYAWHGRGCTPPGCLADGDKLLILKEILDARSNGEKHV